MLSESVLKAVDHPGKVIELEIRSIYSRARIQAFQTGISFLVSISLIELVMTTGLRKRKLVET